MKVVDVRNEKYIVCKRLDDGMHGAEVHDAVVIRLQDVFAESALWTYANEIRAAIEILTLLEIPVDDPHVANLESIAEYFSEMANAASMVTKKVPD